MKQRKKATNAVGRCVDKCMCACRVVEFAGEKYTFQTNVLLYVHCTVFKIATFFC